MRVIPVIDLMHGVVVRGVGGRRSEYRPIESRLCPSAEPMVVARAFREAFGIAEFYVADLDAIQGGAPAWNVYAELMGDGFDLLVDAGVSRAESATPLACCEAGGRQLAGIIAGLESLGELAIATNANQSDQSLQAALTGLLSTIGAARAIFSLDLRGGVPLTSVAAWRELAPRDIAAAAISAGYRRMIVLDLADVGTGGGVRTLDFCRQIRQAHPYCELIAGGGVRGPDDLAALAAAGCDAALVASALHDGRLTRHDCRQDAQPAED